MADAVRDCHCRTAVCHPAFDAKNIGRRWDIKRPIGDKNFMADRSALFIVVAKGDDYFGQYLDWGTAYAFDGFRNFDEHSC